MADKPNLVHVQIFGQTYSVKAALNLADECARLRADLREADGRASGRATALARELAAALDEK